MSNKNELTISIIDRPDGADSPLLSEPLDHVSVKRLLPSQIEDLDPGTDVILIRGGFWDDLPTLLHLAPGLQWIHVSMAGLDHLDLQYLAEKGVLLTNAAGVLDRAIAEFVLGAVLMWAKGLHRSALDTQRRRWETREPLANSSLRTLIIGAGGIGTRCAEALKGAGFGTVAGVRQTSRELAPVFDERIEMADMQDRVGEFDVLISCLPATSTTRSILNESILRRTKESMVLVNIGRGSPIDHDHLAKVLAVRPGALAVLDVTEPEPLPDEHPLWGYANVIISPHMAGETKERHDNYSRLFLDNLDRYIQGLPLHNLVST